MAMLRWLTERLFAARPAHGEEGVSTREADHHVTASDVDVVMYTRRGCHLCDDAQALLERYGLRPQLVDIDNDPELVGRYTNCVPVVVLDGRERFRGRVNEVLLRRLLRRWPRSG